MLMRYSIVELLMVFEVSAQREHTIVWQKLGGSGQVLQIASLLS